MACIADGKDAPEAALVLLNTRINAVGKGAMNSECDREMARTARVKFENMGMKRKREEIEDQLKYCAPYKRPKKSILKRMRLYKNASNPCITPKAVIVPENVFTPYNSFHNTKRKRRVIFSDEKFYDFHVPTVSPEEILSDKRYTREHEWKRVLTLPLL